MINLTLFGILLWRISMNLPLALGQDMMMKGLLEVLDQGEWNFVQVT